ncbi:MAG: outer membrane protein assembly factor [Leptospiraceae bacterium]|nr:outer membrane protein assembly factor [Leptospiraceae bacterium]MDW8306201.1 DUF5982 domain-containing protein [Leptospiraceae bacterium]
MPKKLIFFLTMVYTSVLFAQGATEKKEEKKEGEPEYTFFGFKNPNPPMPGLERKRRLAQRDIDKKKEGGFFTGLPLVNFDPNTGVGYGVRLFYFNNGKRGDPLFEYTPYRHQLFVQYFATTLGWQYHWIDYDAPYIFDSLFRIRTGIIFDRNINAQYYSRGTRSMKKLSVNGVEYSKFSDYTAEIRKIDVNGETHAFRNKYEYIRPTMYASLERDLLGGILRPQLGFQIAHFTIRDYTGKQVLAEGNQKAIQKLTLLKEECNQGLIQGCNGGWNNTIKLGIALDTRDFEPDPNNGLFWDAVVEGAGKNTGSDFTYIRYTAAGRIYYSPIQKIADLVLAARGVISHMEGDLPFFAMNTLGFTAGNQSGLGGLRTLRGYKQDRFVGRTMTVANFEVRWTFFDFNSPIGHLAFILAPFYDVGRPFDGYQKISLNDWRSSYGAGFRIAWNQATIIIVDYGRSEEDSSLFINFNHIF